MPSKLSNFSINDDKGNPLSLRNPVSNSLNLSSGRQRGNPTQDDIDKYGDQTQRTDKTTSLKGFTSPESLLFTSNPKEVGNKIVTDPNLRKDTNVRNFLNKDIQNQFDQAQGGLEFQHFLDKSLIPVPTETLIGSVGDSRTNYPDLTQIYLGSFVTTSDDNEDPTMLGYDLTIDTIDSPLFNGAVEDFITNNDFNNEEVKSRLKTIQDFKNQFFKFFNSNSANLKSAQNPKVYYFKGIKGLDRLVESNTSADTKKSFVNYGEDFITIELNEDVNQNMGYLSTLYKSLSWSRINGKQIVPENLLRFNLNITITEIRKYKRFFSSVNNPRELDFYADKISKYKYTLYECQFFFPRMPHSDALDLSAPKLVDTYEFQFNYKFSTLKFYRFNWSVKEATSNPSAKPTILDNRYANINKIDSENDLVSTGSTIDTAQSSQTLKPITESDNKNSLTQDATQRSQFRQNLERLGGDLRRAAANEINRRVITQARLLNRTLDNIRSSVPLVGRMGSPTNVYEQDQLSLSTDVQNAIRNFAGKSVRGFFKR